MSNGRVERLDADALALSLTGALAQLETVYPGIAGKYGWAKLEDVERFTSALQAAADAKAPIELH